MLNRQLNLHVMLALFLLTPLHSNLGSVTLDCFRNLAAHFYSPISFNLQINFVCFSNLVKTINKERERVASLTCK